jgi:hypothetical protein
VTRLRPEIRALVDGRSLGEVRPDADLATRRFELASEHLESGRDNRRAERLGAARSAFYEAIWYALLALQAAWGLRVIAADEEGQHVVLMRFGERELRDSPEEREAGRSLDAFRQMRNQQMYRQPSSAGLGDLPRLAARVVEAARRRLDDTSPDRSD